MGLLCELPNVGRGDFRPALLSLGPAFPHVDETRVAATTTSRDFNKEPRERDPGKTRERASPGTAPPLGSRSQGLAPGTLASAMCQGAEVPTLRIMWAAACQPRVPMCLLKEMLRCVADS